MQRPDQTFEEYMQEIEDLDHVAYHAAIKKEIVDKMRKSGWCLNNGSECHICPTEFVTAPRCECPCHEGQTEDETASRRRPELVAHHFSEANQPKPKPPLQLKKRGRKKSNNATTPKS